MTDGSLESESRRRSGRSPDARLIEQVSQRYRACGVYHWEWVRQKLTHDPLHRTLPARIGKTSGKVVLDLGCGRGIALAVCAVASDLSPAKEPEPLPQLVGVELDAGAARVAQVALGSRARIEIADLAGYDPPPADIVMLLDVLQYLDPAAQERIVARAARAVRPGGLLLVRVTDAAPGPRFRLTRAVDRICTYARGGWRQRFCYRPAAEWSRLLESCGMVVEASPASAGTPFANVLLEGRCALRSVSQH